MPRFLWIDLEMTGLDHNTNHILEVGVIITDKNFSVLHTYETTIIQSQDILENMNEWCKKHHKKSGLLDRISSGKTEAEVEKDLLDLIKKYSLEKPIIVGNSIAQDRRFIDQYFPKLASKLHYRMLDVSSFKIIFELCYGIKFKKQQSHRALDDIKESIEELKYYTRFFNTDFLAAKSPSEEEKH